VVGLRLGLVGTWKGLKEGGKVLRKGERAM